MWTQWNIDLAALGADLSSVRPLTLGIEGAAAKGVFYVDDIELYSDAPAARSEKVVTWFEAESGAITGPFQTFENPAASGGQYIIVPNGDGSSNGNPADASDGWAVYTLDIPADGDYMIAFRGWNERGGNGSDDSVWVNIPGMVTNDEAQHASGWLRSNGVLHGPTGAMVGDLVFDDQEGRTDPVVFTMTAGQHELQVSRREDGTGLDAIAILSAN